MTELLGFEEDVVDDAVVDDLVVDDAAVGDALVDDAVVDDGSVEVGVELGAGIARFSNFENRELGRKTDPPSFLY